METIMVMKLPTGIEGFDEITFGGLPKDRTTLVIGGPGSGKTVFALQSLVNGANQRNEPGIFVAFEENSRQIVVNALTFGWDLPQLERQKLFFLDAHLSPEIVEAGDFEITPILAALKAKAQEMKAKRIVFDGMDVLLTLLDNAAAERREVYRLHHWLLESGMTGILTAKVEGNDPFVSTRYSFLQFMADCVVVFHHRLSDRVSLRGLRVAKYRGSNHSANEFPLVITSAGVQVAGYSPAELMHEALTERVSTGVGRLDTMLGGGYFRNSCVLVSGAPGTAKTTLGGAFVESACRDRGERALYISFDEAAEALVRNLSSVNIQLAPHLESGLLRIYSVRTGTFSAEEHFINSKMLMDQHQTRFMVIDPISALTKTGGQVAATDAILRLIDLAKTHGITVLCTSLLDGPTALSESTPSDISTISDTWIHLSYVISGGERNRALTVIKSRGMRHSNQVRELLLSDDGIALADVYTAQGEVLMGTARCERETQEQMEELRVQAEHSRKRRELELDERDLSMRIEALQREVEARRAQIALLEEEEQLRQKQRSYAKAELLGLREADWDTREVFGSDVSSNSQQHPEE
jgi:circadian clock protein KaiC